MEKRKRVRYDDPSWVGQRFGRLTVLGYQPAVVNGRSWDWIVKCDCGTVKTVGAYFVYSGQTVSCGCYFREVRASRPKKFEHPAKEYKRLYGIYNGIKKRCYCKTDFRYKDYGGRGIVMCDEWLNPIDGFDKYVDWSLSHGYADNLTIERLDVNGNYCPENCAWITLQEQRYNTRDTLWVNFRGERVRFNDLCALSKVSYDTLHDRVFSRGWDIERALSEPSERNEKSFAQKCREHGINPGTAQSRIAKLGWSEERALNTPPRGRGSNQKTYN